MGSSDANHLCQPCTCETKPCFMKWLSKIFKGGPNRGSTSEQHPQFPGEESMVWRLPPRSTDFSDTNLHFMDKDNAAGTSLYPLHRCKILHLVRHAQGIHNLPEMANFKKTPELLDAKLSPLGWIQVDNLRQHVHASGLIKRIELVITSPLLRTMQTAAGVFGCHDLTDGMDVIPLMVADVNSRREAISSLNCPPFIAVELCRESMGVYPCDKRRSVSEYKKLFPAIDFSLIESDEDIWWKEDVRETDEEVAARGMKFMKWLWTRKENEIAIVSHSFFWNNTLKQFGNDCDPSVKSEMCKMFTNCELRSLVFVDKGMLGLDPSTTN